MFNQTVIRRGAKLALSTLLICVLSLGLVSCGGEEPPQPEETEDISKPKLTLTEVPPPAIFEELRQTLDSYQPQVSILSPKNGEVIEDTRVSIEVDVKDYPLFKNEDLGMGPHLHVILDNQPYRAAYTADEPIIFEDLSPGTHTIRMFASRPWHESFKNEGAYAVVTFHLFTETGDNAPDSEAPLLTYSRPKATYGAEPILLDYYLTNAPIRGFEQESNSEVEVNPASQRDWRVRATINGESFIMDSWLPVYLEGFEEGQNWIKLELLDGDGNPIENAFNTAARLFTYQPDGQDTLSQLVRGELTAEEARVIVDADYQVPTEEVTPETEEEAVTEEEVTPEAETPTEEEVTETEEVTSETEEEVTSETKTPLEEEVTETEEVTSETEEEVTPEAETPIEETMTEEEATSEETETVTEKDTPTEETPTEEVTPETEEEVTPEAETPTEEETVIEKEVSSEETVTEEETATEMPTEEEKETTSNSQK
ncbi:DUF6130 family protein [Dactylococcopsis salina]|uniref:Uncharacterized protein n=1 Tax=Dactylococcopsis salina (strain PCC 8305) TaxID=13035 RepID=K9YTV9_DACS8|nr:DUF6130 family protein [Dactylococcopsis salina]AFZ50324.1 hypothetical protein Dacsa_1657 [Dactylococcopsis salina PCC 8305]